MPMAPSARFRRMIHADYDRKSLFGQIRGLQGCSMTLGRCSNSGIDIAGIPGSGPSVESASGRAAGEMGNLD